MLINSSKLFPTIFCHFFICIATVKVLQFLTFVSDQSVFNKFYSNAFFKSIQESYVRNVVPKLQRLILRVTRRDVQLEHCIVPNVPISPQNHKTFRITILLRSTAPQNLISPSSVNFVMQHFPAFMLYVNTKTLNMDLKWDAGKQY